jgi:molecular chaperone DnaJ
VTESHPSASLRSCKPLTTYRPLTLRQEPDAAEKFKEVKEAYEALIDDQKRQLYDQFGEAGVKRGAGSPFGGGAQGGFNEVDLGDIFDTFFGGAGGRGAGFGGARAGAGAGARRRSGPRPGDDLRVDLSIPLRTSVFGGQEKLRISHLETCGTCSGSGVKPGSKVNTCKTCRGGGVVTQVTRTPLGNFQTQTVCPECGGSGQVVEEYCGACSGQGRVEKQKQIKVDIPAGVNDGQKLRVKGEGDAGLKGGESGDLYIFIAVEKDPVFRRDGTDIYSDLRVSYVDAILGTKVKVPVIDGDAEISIKEGTQPGAILRLKGRGVPKLMSGDSSQRGDHYFTVGVDIPTSLSEAEREIVEELRKEREGQKEKSGGGFFSKFS